MRARCRTGIRATPEFLVSCEQACRQVGAADGADRRPTVERAPRSAPARPSCHARRNAPPRPRQTLHDGPVVRPRCRRRPRQCRRSFPSRQRTLFIVHLAASAAALPSSRFHCAGDMPCGSPRYTRLALGSAGRRPIPEFRASAIASSSFRPGGRIVSTRRRPSRRLPLQVTPVERIPALVVGDPASSSPMRSATTSTASHGVSFAGARRRGARWRALADISIANAVIEAQIARRAELLREERERSDDFIGKMRDRSLRCLTALDKRVPQLGATSTSRRSRSPWPAAIRDWRYPSDDWRSAAPGLATWFDRVSPRLSLRATAPAETCKQPRAR